ncbi:MAG: FtsX-like permease family protein [Lachnospiraceae bacterium]|nr:FtsX-like permease family protein [Lachnospiraceae bacterium]
MGSIRLAFNNFKKSFRNYFSMILSLSFTIMILYNFVNLTYTETFKAFGEKNKNYIDIIIQVVSVVLICFMFFFIWYATNVFLTKRKKEIGIYVFMGLTNRKIGKIYAMETIMTGIAALVLGILCGVVSTQLFQLLLFTISDISIDISFRFTWEPVIITVVVYVVIYMIFVIKGYVNIVRSSVLEMISAIRQNEYVKTNNWILFGKAVLGITILLNGYYLAVKESGFNVMANLLSATVFVIVGTYLVFGGFLPILFQKLADNKRFLYSSERNLWINNVIFRMKKNYRTYAMTCVLLTCSVTALAAAFAQKDRYDNMVHFRNTYTFQLVSNMPDLGARVTDLIEQDNDIVYSSEGDFFVMDGSHFDDGFTYGILSFSGVKKMAEAAGLDFPYDELKDDEVICANHIYLLSFITDRSDVTITIDGKKYRQIDETTVPYMGYMQEGQTYYIVSDKTYDELLAGYNQWVSDNASIAGDKQEMQHDERIYIYNYRIQDIYNYAASMDELDTIMENTDGNYVGRVAINPNSDDIMWIKVEYSLCVFMFLVFVVASGSILFMKLYNDSFEEKERYGVLTKIGVAKKTLGKAIAKELRVAYGVPFLLMMVSSYFAVHSLEKMMSTNLKLINLLSVGIIFVFFLAFYKLSVILAVKNSAALS